MSDQEALRNHLQHVEPGPRVWVDDTGGTAAMSLAAQQAATAVGIPLPTQRWT